ncbi:hypothetical protein C5B85_01860 [Pseudoclavibacter sp. AY1F1]|uniref:hypothetical protein n=1 Tax=Pseudoclavibacter sp. AY1F1 TaxID=2080583 RepID=UPI000CE7CF07|nr:hypothetical protein [Pseudoclavibacter sp. AY1F1]PPF47045.1 hypothetical protein C5B85_01860 [Pseudoclavibacter sp. AY1F1]
MRRKDAPEEPKKAKPRFSDYFTEARGIYAWAWPLAMGVERREQRVLMLTQLETAQQLRIQNLLTLLATPGLSEADRSRAFWTLNEPGPDGTPRLRQDVSWALGMPVDANGQPLER